MVHPCGWVLKEIEVGLLDKKEEENQTRYTLVTCATRYCSL